jgi:hypothetical protein
MQNQEKLAVNAGVNMVDPSCIGVHKQGAGWGAVNANANMREVNPLGIDLHK